MKIIFGSETDYFWNLRALLLSSISLSWVVCHVADLFCDFVQEFECDVSVEGGVDVGGQERQEFSFTLYDFDGHGKITKDVSTRSSTR